MRLLVIGDAHLKINILSEARSFIDQLLIRIRTMEYDHVVLLGDQFDTFAVVRTEVLGLWTKFFQEASKHTKVIALVGNHDLAGAEGGSNPMEPFSSYKNVRVVSKPVLIDGMWFVPFMRSNDDFAFTLAHIDEGSHVFCHQSFNGCQFENGFYDPNGADVQCAEHLASVISGHVHKQQTLGNIWYPGTPFQHTFNDADEVKFIYEISLSAEGYNVTDRIILEMPRFVVFEQETIPELLLQVERLASPQAHFNYKFIARGTPSEIAQFWADPKVKDFKSKAKRVVDALVSIKPDTVLTPVTGKTHQEKLHEYVQNRKWRTQESARLILLAEKYLTN